MDTQFYPSSVAARSNTVELQQSGDEWFVRVTENGQATVSPGFDLEAFAISFAEGQCARLGLTGFTRI